MNPSLEITPLEAQQQLAESGKAVMIDVREPQEFALTRVEASELIPLNTIPGKLEYLRQIAAEHPVLLLCHHGVRSLQAAMWLRSQGIENCLSVTGGIDRWSLEVDRGVPRY